MAFVICAPLVLAFDVVVATQTDVLFILLDGIVVLTGKAHFFPTQLVFYWTRMCVQTGVMAMLDGETTDLDGLPHPIFKP